MTNLNDQFKNIPMSQSYTPYIQQPGAFANTYGGNMSGQPYGQTPIMMNPNYSTGQIGLPYGQPPMIPNLNYSTGNIAFPYGQAQMIPNSVYPTGQIGLPNSQTPWIPNYGYTQPIPDMNQFNPIPNPNFLNTSQQSLNNSLMGNPQMMQYGLGLVPQYASQTGRVMAPTNLAQQFGFAGSMQNPYLMTGQQFDQRSMSSKSYSQSFLDQIRENMLQQMVARQQEVERLQKQKDEEKEELTRIQEDFKNIFLNKMKAEDGGAAFDLRDFGLFRPSIKIDVPRSEYFYDRDRYFFEELILNPLKTEGIFGTKLVTGYDKSQLYDDKTTPQMYLSQNDDSNEYFAKMVKDGIYLDYIKKRIYSYNLQKVEQRALREGKKDWFRINGDLRVDNDIFSDVVTKPCDISLTSNDRFITQSVSSSLCTRSSERNFKRYKLKLIISKLCLKAYPLFSEEDILCSELKELHREYYKRMNLLNIPYLKEKITIISKQLDEYSLLKEPSEAVKTEIKNMSTFIAESMKFLEDEKKILNEKANLLYSKWQELKRLREVQKYQSTNVKLSVLRFPSKGKENPNIFDYAFLLTNTETTNDLNIIPKTEIDRRAKVAKTMCYLKVYVNRVFALESNKYPISWPSFEIDVNNMFILNVYTRPTKLELELYMGNYSYEKVCRFEIEPPGIFMDTVTSTSSLFEEVDFESLEQPDRLNPINKLEISNTLNLNNPKEKNEEATKLLADNQQQVNSNKNTIKSTKGRIYLKAEWEGKAPDMPPTKIEDKLNLVSRQQNFKAEIMKINNYDYPFDVNDPRNVAFFQQMKKSRTELLLKYLYKEYLLQFFDLRALRHFLLTKRNEKYSLRKLKIPILENEIENEEGIKATIKDLEVDLKNKDQTLEEYEQKIKTSLEKLNSMYSGKILSEQEYLEMLSKKIKTMKRDIMNKLQLSYFQIINEVYYKYEWWDIVKEFCIALFSRARKLAPIRKRPTPVKVEKTTEIKINIHVVKGYNIPVRIASIPSSVQEELKEMAVGRAYGKIGGMSSTGMMNQALKRDFNADFYNLQQKQNYGSAGNIPSIGNIKPNDLFGMNNSGAFNTPNIGTNNQSINFNVNDYNNLNQIGMPNIMGFNPHLGTPLYNPEQPANAYPYYNQPNNIPLEIKNYDGDILRMLELLRNIEQNVESFIQVKVIYYDQETELRTDSIDGIHPDYNFKVQIPIKPKNGEKYFSREELSQCPGVIYFTLYDEVRSDKKIDEKDAKTYIYRYEKKYLGSFSIPFTTVFQNAALLDTMCKVNIPMTVFGYYSDVSSTFDLLQSKENDLRGNDLKAKSNVRLNNPQEKNELVPDIASKSSMILADNLTRIVNPYINTYLSLYITLDPVPGFLKQDDLDYVPGFEDSIFLINASKWLTTLKEDDKLKDRHVRVFAENFDGYSVFMPRYLRPDGQKPHPLIFDETVENDSIATEKVARYVALIPFVEDAQTFDHEEVPDCWCTDEQFLTLGFGDYEEHAILLCNYFNYVDQKQNNNCVSYLVLAKGYPEGLTTYVMRMSIKTPEVEFWNAKTGDCFYFDKTYQNNTFLGCTISRSFKNVKTNSDTICQLKEIGCIVTFDNVYVNIQDLADPGQIDLNFQNSAKWKPFLTETSKTKYFPKGITSVQKDLSYENPSTEEGHMLKEHIYQYLKREIELSRAAFGSEGKPLRTNWDRVANEQIESILAEYDLYCFTHKKSGINYSKTNRDISSLRKADQAQMLKLLETIQQRIQQQFIDVREVYGFPINISYTTTKEVWEEVKLTDVHLVADEDSELSLSVYVNPLPSKVNSVWIFFAIIRKRL